MTLESAFRRIRQYKDARALVLTAAQEKHRGDLLEQAMKMQRGQEGWGDEREELLRDALSSHFPDIKPLEGQVNQLISERIAILHSVREKADEDVVKIGLRRESGLLILDELRALADGAPSAFDCDWRWEVRAEDLYFIVDEPTVPPGFVSSDKTVREGREYRILHKAGVGDSELLCSKEAFEALIRAIASSDSWRQLSEVSVCLAQAFDAYYKQLAKYSLAYELPGKCDFCPESTLLGSGKEANLP